MVIYLEPDILECEIKRDFRSITMIKSGDGGIPAELFQILNDVAVKVLHSLCKQIWKNQQWPQTEKVQFSLQFQRKAMPKNVQINIQLHSLHMLASLCSKFYKLGFNSM